MKVRPAHTAISILGLLTLFSIGYWFIHEKDDGYRPLMPIVKTHQPYAPRAVRLEEKTEYASISGTYPQFEQAPISFNNEIRDVVKNAIEEHKKLSEENWKAMHETDTSTRSTPAEQDLFPFSVSFEAPLSTKDDISVALFISQYSGGAHGSSSIRTFTYNIPQKRNVSLSDVFKGYPEYLKKLSIESRKQLTERFSDIGDGSETTLDFLEEGTEPKDELFSLFTLSPQKDMLTIYFGLYQVAPYVYGEQHIVVPLPKGNDVPEWLQ